MINVLKLAAVCAVLGLTSACSTVTPEQLSAVDAKATRSEERRVGKECA